MSEEAAKEQERKVFAEGVTPGLSTCLYSVGGLAIIVGVFGTLSSLSNISVAAATLGLGTVISGLLFCAIAGVLTRLHRAVYHLGYCSILLGQIEQHVRPTLEHAEAPGEPQKQPVAKPPEEPISQEELDARLKNWQQKGR